LASLRYTDTQGQVRRFNLKKRAGLGRHPAQDIQLLDRVVSKEHAIIEFKNNGFWVTDCASRNGTLLNGEPLTTPTLLSDKDEITIGSTCIAFEAKSPSDLLRDRVTVQGSIESAIRTRVSSREELGFLPEHAIRDVEALRRDYEKLRIANELNQALSNEFDIDRLLHKILDRAFHIFRCDRGVILIRDEEGEFVPRAANSRSKRESFEDIRISETILNEVIGKHEAILSSDAQVDSRFSGSQSIIMEGIRSTMSVPLLYQDKLLGVIHLDSQVATGAFLEKDLQLLSGFARQGAVFIEHADLVRRMNAEALNREKLSRLLPPSLVDQVMEGEVDIRQGGDVKRVTMMFADIRGFTPMAERLPPQEMVTMLNEYFEVMVDIVFKRGGTLDKFIGDAVMAIWGAPFSRSDDVNQAVAAALEMQTALAEFNETRQLEGLEPIHIGIGLNTGEVVAGYMGSSRAMNYTAIGDVVNVAARLCDMAKPGTVIVTRDTLQGFGNGIHVKAMPPAMLKGKTHTVEVFHVISVDEQPYPTS